MAGCRTCIHAYTVNIHVYCRLKEKWIQLDKMRAGCNNYTPNPLLKPKKPIKFINLHMRFEPVRS